MNTPRLAISALRLGSFRFQGLSDVSYTCIVYPHNYRQRHVNTSRITVFTPDDRALLYEYENGKEYIRHAISTEVQNLSRDLSETSPVSSR